MTDKETVRQKSSDTKTAKDKDKSPKQSASSAEQDASFWKNWVATLKDRASDWRQWVRALYMVLSGIVFYICFGIFIWFLVAFQFLSYLLTGKLNQPLLEFGGRASDYAVSILKFVTYQTEKPPWPFTEIPPKK